MKFKEGDKVMRTDDGYFSCEPNTVYTVARDVSSNDTVFLKEIDGQYLTSFFRKIESVAPEPYELPEDLFRMEPL